MAHFGNNDQFNLNYKLYFRSDDPLKSVYDVNHQQMLKILKRDDVYEKIKYFKRSLKSNNREVFIDKKWCYIGDILYYDNIKPHQQKIYDEIVVSKKFSQRAKHIDYAIIKSDGNTFLPERSYKVFDHELNYLNRYDLENTELLIQNLYLTENKCQIINNMITERGEDPDKDQALIQGAQARFNLN